MEPLIVALQYCGAVIWTLFCVWYTVRAKWWKSPTGRNVFFVAAAIAAFMLLVTAQITWPGYEYRPYAQVLVYGSIVWLGAQRIFHMEREQRKHTKESSDD